MKLKVSEGDGGRKKILLASSGASGVRLAETQLPCNRPVVEELEEPLVSLI